MSKLDWQTDKATKCNKIIDLIDEQETPDPEIQNIQEQINELKRQVAVLRSNAEGVIVVPPYSLTNKILNFGNG